MTSDVKPLLNAGRVVFLLVLAKLLLHLVTFSGYGIFRDELYYLACSRRLAWGYVEFPPMIAALTRVVTSILGESLFAVRLLPALAGAALVGLAALIARELGGGRFAQALAGLSVIVAPGWLSIDHILNTNAFDPLLWMGCVLMGIRALKTGESRYWLWFGVIAGLGLLNKHAMLFFGFAFVAGLALTPARKMFAQRNLWIGGGVAALLFLPNLLWEMSLGWPTLEFLQNAVKYKNAILTPWQFFTTQLLLTGSAAPVWMAGLGFYFFHERGKPFRALGWAYVFLFAILCTLRGKGYYMLPVYPMLMAAGGVLFEEWLARKHWHWLKPVLVTSMVLLAAAMAPLAIPVLPVDAVIRYSAWLGVQPKEERHQLGALPQLFADIFGWRNMAEQVATAFYQLTPEEQAHAAIWGNNYGEAVAIDYFGARLGIPNAISGHNNYFLWGPGNSDPQVVIAVGINTAEARKIFGDIRAVGLITAPYVMPYENNLRVWVCRQPKVSLRQVWPKLKFYL